MTAPGSIWLGDELIIQERFNGDISTHGLDSGTYNSPKLEVPSIFVKAYILGLCFREYPHEIWPEIWYSTSILGS